VGNPDPDILKTLYTKIYGTLLMTGKKIVGLFMLIISSASFHLKLQVGLASA